jgi:tRNA pseudouridine55 synthase
MNFILNLDKPKHISSQQAVTEVKRFLGTRKAGHAGTLDPLATGVLLVCVNEATKIARFLSDLDKEYHVTMRLGVRTDTYDSTGTIVEERYSGGITEKDVAGALYSFRGNIMQIPPMYSAIKVDGKALYILARKGIVLERQPRKVRIDQINLLSFMPPFVELLISCSKGTYIRSICEDLGVALGTGAHMVSLRRTRIGPFHIKDAATPSEMGTKKSAVSSVDEALGHLPSIIFDDVSIRKLINGQVLSHEPYLLKKAGTESGGDMQHVRLKTEKDTFIGIGRIEGGRVHPERMFTFGR